MNALLNPLRIIAITACLLMGLMGPALAATDVADIKVDDRISGDVTIPGDRVVPLPPGEWIAVGVRNGVGKKAQWPWREVVLAQVRGKVITRMVMLNTDESVKWKGYKPYKTCTNERNFSSSVITNAHGGDQNCWYVGAWCTRKTDDESNNFYRKSLNDLARRDGLYQPAALIGYRTVMADEKSRFKYTITVNSDMILPATTEKGMWISDDWTGDAVNNDPLRKAVMEALTKQGQVWHQRLETVW